jgi:hypothetical protein
MGVTKHKEREHMTNTLTLNVTGITPDNMGDPQETDYTVTIETANGAMTVTITNDDGTRIHAYNKYAARIIQERLHVALLRCERPKPGTIGLAAEPMWDLGTDGEVLDLGPQAWRIVDFMVESGIG